MKKLFRMLFCRNPIVWTHCTKKYSFPPWPNYDISHCGEVSWNYKPLVKGKI